jgi:hypothetical protein
VRVTRHLSASVLVIAGIAASALAASPVAGSASTAAASTAGSAKNINLSPATRTQLLHLYAARRGVAVSDISEVAPGMAHGAVVSPGGEDWAMITFVPAASAPVSLDVKFQDGADTGVFSRLAGGAWKVAGLGGLPVGCSAGLPSAVRTLWQLASCTAPATPPSSASAGASAVTPEATSVAMTLVGDIARSQVGIADNPAVTSFNGLDCDPFTAIEVPSVSTSGCGIDSTYGIRDGSEFWCADFAKWAWRAAGVTSDLSTLTAAAASFYNWGKAHKESMPKDPTDPEVGDAIIFYPGTSPNGSYADHVGIVTAVHSNGTVNLANGDFLGSTNISVQGNDNVSVKSWAAAVFGAGETWTYVSPELSLTTHSAAEQVSAQSGKCLDTKSAKFADGTKEEIWSCNKGAGQEWTYSSSGQLTVDGGKYCLDVKGKKTANGTIVDLWACNGGANQQWTFGPGGTIVGAQSGKCLNVEGEKTANGTQMIIWSCNTAANEKWSWS